MTIDFPNDIIRLLLGNENNEMNNSNNNEKEKMRRERERERECIQVNSARLQSSVLHCNFCNCNISRIYLVQRQCYVRGLIYKYYNEREESTYFKLRESNFFEVFFDFSSVRISIGFGGFHGRISC